MSRKRERMDSSDEEEMVEILMRLSKSRDEYKEMCELFDDGYDEQLLEGRLEEDSLKSPETSPKPAISLKIPDDCLPPWQRRKRRCRKPPAAKMFEELGHKYVFQLDDSHAIKSHWVDTGVDPEQCLCSSNRAGRTHSTARRCQDCGHDRVCSLHIIECRTLDEVGRTHNRLNAFYERLETRQLKVD
jgi:hypothetical protein